MALDQIRLAADVGGTFTDVAAFNETTGELELGKALTTPARLVSGIEHGVGKAGANFRAARLFLHGTTVAINTILERTGAPCALLTTQGFRDIYEIGRVNRPESYNLFFRRHEPLIERDLRSPQRGGEPALHVRRSPPIEAPVDDRAAEGILRPRARIADRHDVDVRVERERAAAAGPGKPCHDQRMRRKGRGRADVPAVDLEAEAAEEVTDVTDTPARLLRKMRRLLRLALCAEADQVTEELL
jgi:hypothetical protein